MNLQNDPVNIAYIVGWIVYFWIRKIFIDRTKEVKKTVSRFDKLERLLLLGMVPGILILPLVYLFTHLLAFADYSIPAAVQWAGAVLMVYSLWLFWRSHADLGLNWSVSIELRQDHELMTTGVYRSIRHPMYASIWLWALAQGMMLQNWLAGWFILVAFAALYFLRIPREEKLMLEKFGTEYQAYMQRTGRLFPRIGKDRTQ